MSYWQGMKGLGKAVLHKDRAPSLVINARRMKCRACPMRRGAKCTKCGCLIMAKTTLSSESCPGGRW